MCPNCRESPNECDACYQEYVADRQGAMDITLDKPVILRYNPMLVQEDVCFFYTKERAMDLDKVPEIVQEMVDIVKNPKMDEYYANLELVRQKLFAAIGIPKEYIEPMPPKPVEAKIATVCECGGERAKTTHSGWCPKA